MREQEVVKILHELGIKEHLKGYKYLVDSILLFQDNIKIGDVYRDLAIKYKSNEFNIERSIRYIIYTSFNYKMTLFLEIDKYKLSNKEFIFNIWKKARNN